jgi:hypothetical protein
VGMLALAAAAFYWVSRSFRQFDQPVAANAP